MLFQQGVTTDPALRTAIAYFARVTRCDICSVEETEPDVEYDYDAYDENYDDNDE